jgi:hypothetical protein
MITMDASGSCSFMELAIIIRAKRYVLLTLAPKMFIVERVCKVASLFLAPESFHAPHAC